VQAGNLYPEEKEGNMKTPSKIEMIYRLVIGAFLLLLGLFAEMSTGATIFMFVIAAFAFVEAYLRALGKDPFSKGTLEGIEEHPTHAR
jgi:hypothetical protein